MQDRRGHQHWMAATALAGFGLVEAWALWRFGAAEASARNLVLLWLLVPLLLVLSWPLWNDRIDIRMLGLAVVGLLVLAQVALRPTLEAIGYVHLATGWIALFVSLRLVGGEGRPGRGLVAILILFAICEALYGLAQSITGSVSMGVYLDQGRRVATGTLINRNHFAALLNLLWPLALAGLFAHPATTGPAGSRGSERLAKGWIVLLACSLIGAAVLASQSRGGAISLLLTLLFMAVLLRLGRRRAGVNASAAIIVVVLLCLVLAMAAAFGIGALAQRFAAMDESLLRLDVYGDVLRMVGDHWIAGVGPGMFRWRYPLYQTGDTGQLYDHAHNDYLESLAEWGLPMALVVWGWVIWRFVRSSLRAVSTRRSWSHAVALGTAGSLFSILVHSLVDFSLQIPAVLVAFASVLGLAWSVGDAPAPRVGPARTAKPLVGRLDLAARLLLLTVLVAAGVATLQRYRAQLAMSPGQGLAGLQRAIELDPAAPEPRFLSALAHRDLPGAQDLSQAAVQLEMAIRLNPYSPRYWTELSRLQELEGGADEAERSMRVAVGLEPRYGRHRWRLANLLLRRGLVEQAMVEMRRSVELDPRLAEAAALQLLKSGVAPAEIAESLPRDPGSRLRLLRALIRVPSAAGSAVEMASGVWGELLSGDEACSIPDGRFYVEHLVESERAEEARQAWTALMHVNGLVDEAFESDASRVWNGSFELPLSGSPLGWQVRGEDAFSWRRTKAGVAGGTALEIEFAGNENVDFAHLYQLVALPPGTGWRLAFLLRSESLSTDQGVFVEVVSGDRRRRLAATDPVTGTNDWASFSAQLSVPADDGLVWVRLRRLKSQQIDSRLRGKVWLDAVRVEPILP